jgi:F0F1-type ATP synthase membrane subunit b/b'
VLPLAIVFAVLAAAAVIWGVTRNSAASSAKVRADALDERVRHLEASLTTASEKVSFAEQAARQAEQQAGEQSRRADQAIADARRSDEMAEDAVKRAIAAERAATEANARARRAEAEVGEAHRDRDATLAHAGPFHPEALWQLEEQRIERLWRDRLALQPHEASPMKLGGHDVGAALRILSEASREESGVVVDLMWHVDFECPPDRCIQLVRLGEELIAAMRESEGGELEVIGEEDRTIFFLIRTLPPLELPERLTAVFDDFGAMREMADSTVVVRVPARDDAKLDADEQPDIDLTNEAESADQPSEDADADAGESAPASS